jgi:hypothetical protein
MTVTPRTPGMDDLVQQLRELADVGTADFVIASDTYWSYEHLQTALDRHRITIYQQELEQWPTLNTSNVFVYQEYRAPIGNLESGTAVFSVQQLNGGTAPAYTVDYNTGVITFTADTAGTAYMLSARAYDVYAAAADVWRAKMANAAKYFDFSTDNHSFKKSQFKSNCLEMAKYFDSQSMTNSFSVTTITRSDVNA